MTTIEVARAVLATKTAHAFRETADGYEAKPWGSVPEVVAETEAKESDRPVPASGWVLLDLFTASAIVEVHDALSAPNRARLAAMDLPRAADLVWKVVTKIKASTN